MSSAKTRLPVAVPCLLLTLAALLCGATMATAAGEEVQVRRIYTGLDAKDSVDELGCFAPALGNACIVFNHAPELPIVDNSETSDEVVVTSQSIANLGLSNCIIRDLNAAVYLNHSYVGDLIVELERANLSRDLYFPLVSCSATSLDAIFDDEGPTVPNSCPAVGVRLRPDEPLNAFDGRRLDARWELKVQDVASGDTGTLHRWGVAADVDCDVLTTGCTGDADTLCLNQNRFKVEVDWRNSQGGTGIGMAEKLTADTGYFWFFDVNNVEVVVKVLNGCGFNNRYWVFVAGLTDVRVDITVTDTDTGASKTYRNPLNTAFLPIQDTDAFASCP